MVRSHTSHFLVIFSAIVACHLGSSTLQADIVYEDFDYVAAADVVGQTGGTGLSGAYSGAGTSANFDVVGGLSFGALEVSGGASGRTDRAGNGAIFRSISAAAQTEISAATQIWFSALVDPTDTTLMATGGFATNTYGTLAFGNSNFTGGSGAAVPSYNGGTGFGFGFADTSDNAGDFANVQIQGVAFDNGTLSQGTRVVTGDVTSFIVGQVDFATDTVTLWNVTDPSLALPAATLASFTIAGGISGSDLTTISIGDAQTSIFDEIRIGTTLAAVTPAAVPEPSSLLLIGLSGIALMVRRRR